jgi:cytoskeleton protein RodZ
MRAKIDVSEVEATTKIRAKYLRALENEEWGLLPGPTFVKSFLRTYAQALGLDAKGLVEEYRLSQESPNESYEPIVASSRPGSARQRAPRGGPSRGYIGAVTGIGALIVLLVVLLATSGGSGAKHHASATHKGTSRTGSTSRSTTAAGAPPQPVKLSIRPSATVYVCLKGDHGRTLIAGHNLEAGATTQTYTAKRFELTLGNSSATLFIDGRERTVPASGEAIGYAITRGRGRKRLTGTQLPTCK